MATAVFSSLQGAGSATYADGNTLDYSVTGQYLVGLDPEYKRVDIQPVNMEGVDGGGTKDFGFRGQMVMLRFTYVLGSEAACFAAWQSDLSVIGGLNTVVAGGQTFNACKCHAGKASQPRGTGFGTLRMEAYVVIEALRP